jgi:hypothetical protein
MEQAGMGIDAADFDNDGDLDIAKINFSDDMNNLYRNEGNGEFSDAAGSSGFGPVSTPYLGFGVKFADFDNDGLQDVFVANGHVNPQVDGHKFGVSYAERNLVFRNVGSGKVMEIGLQTGPALKVPRVGRGLATADFDHDGRLDILVSNLDGEPLLLRNASPAVGHWIGVAVKDGIGARVTLHAAGRSLIGEVRANDSYLSSSEPVVRFGLGAGTKVDLLEVKWPNGVTKRVTTPGVDQVLTIQHE